MSVLYKRSLSIGKASHSSSRSTISGFFAADPTGFQQIRSLPSTSHVSFASHDQSYHLNVFKHHGREIQSMAFTTCGRQSKHGPRLGWRHIWAWYILWHLRWYAPLDLRHVIWSLHVIFQSLAVSTTLVLQGKCMAHAYPKFLSGKTLCLHVAKCVFGFCPRQSYRNLCWFSWE